MMSESADRYLSPFPVIILISIQGNFCKGGGVLSHLCRKKNILTAHTVHLTWPYSILPINLNPIKMISGTSSRWMEWIPFFRLKKFLLIFGCCPKNLLLLFQCQIVLLGDSSLKGMKTRPRLLCSNILTATSCLLVLAPQCHSTV